MSGNNKPLMPAKRRDNRKVQQLIKELMKVWSSKGVEENYQNYYLTYLDSLPQHLVELEISREIKKTLENKSHYFNINKALALHGGTVAKLKIAVEKLEPLAISNKISQSDLEYVCGLIDDLRTHNMLVAQNTLSFNSESSSKSNSQFGFVHGNNYLFQKINNDHAFIKESFLRKYIVFTHSYDPFFLYHYETAKTTNDNKYKRHEAIEKLFGLSISRAYKIMKLQQEVLEYLSGKIPTEREQKGKGKKVKRQHYSIVEKGNFYKSTIRETEEENSSSKKLDNSRYMGKVREQELQSDGEILFKRSKTDVDSRVISQYFGSGIGQQKPKLRQVPLPLLKKRDSARYSIHSQSHQKNNQIQPQRRQRLYTMGNQQNIIEPITINNSSIVSQNRRNSVSIVRRKQKGVVKNQLPLKYQKPKSPNKDMLRVEESQINIMRGGFQSGEGQIHEQPNLNRELNGKNMVHYRGGPAVEQQNLREPPSAVKNFKLKAGNLSVHSLFIFLKELNVKQRYRKIFQIGNWQYSIRSSQYYLHKLYINQILMAVVLSCAVPEGDIVVKYWGPTNECEEPMSNFLFRKYLEHIERHTICKNIFYNAVGIPEVFYNNFTQQKQRIFRRQRSLPIQMQYYNYQPFFSLDFTSIAIPRSTNKDTLDNIIVPSNITIPFNQKQFFCFNYLLIVNKLINPGQLKSIGSFSSGMDMKDVHGKLIKEEFFFNPYNQQSKAQPINLLTIKMRNPIFSAFFVAQRPFIKFVGSQVYSDKQCLVVTLPLLKHNTILYFAKGFKSIGDMMAVVKNRPAHPSPIEYCVRMFSKRLRGRIQSINLREEVCFGDMEVIFEWRDFLKGRIEHNFEQLQKFGQGDSFYCLLQIQNQNIFVFEVNQTNFL